MNLKALYREIGLIDEALIDEAERKHRSGAASRRWLFVAACLALVVTAGSLWQGGLFAPEMTAPDGVPPVENPGIVIDGTDSDALTLNRASSAMSASRVIDGHFWQTLSATEINAVFPTAEGHSGSYEITAKANYSKTEEAGIRLVDVAGEFVSADGITARVTTSPSEIIKCYLIDGEPVLSEIGGVSVDAGYFDKTNDGSVLYYADFKRNDVYYYVELKGGKGEKAALFALLDFLIRGGEADFSAITPKPPAVLRNDVLSLEQARADETFGRFIPRSFPAGFVLNEAHRFVNQQSDFLSVSLSQGMDNIMWHVSHLGEEERGRLTSTADTQNYDLALYPIPYADSVPKELREIVDYPIFSIEELTLPVVKARAYLISDAGDTGGYRMDFGVLYGDILVEVSAKGVAPEKIFSALTEITP